MKKIILHFAFLLVSFNVLGQNISGIINQYAQVNAINLNVISVNSSAGFNIGDKVLLIKMKGASINQTNTVLYGDTTALNDAGKYLFSHISAINANFITLDTFCNIFDNAQYIQLISVPVYPNPSVSGTLTCQTWNGTTGGILVFETPGTLTLNANIDVSFKGFRGGQLTGTTFNCGSVDFFSPFPGLNGQKGEAISDWILGQEGGAGKLVNGGGGAYAGNSGAGGGGNGGTGGAGGNQYSGCNPVNKNGLGGIPNPIQLGRMFLGGGGGGPQRDNGQTVYPGGNGGGLVHIMANNIVGNGFSITSNGGDVDTLNDEGAAAGGAGGSIYLMSPTYTGNISLIAKGGFGGSNFNTIFTSACHGPGGGGGGGLIWLSNPALPAGVNTNLAGGLAGYVLNPASSCFNTHYSAQDGSNGQLKFNYVPPVINPISLNLGPDLPICLGQTITLDAGPNMASYLWDDLSTNQTRNVTNPGTYFVTVLNSIGCIGSDTIDVFIDTSVKADFSVVYDYGCNSDSVYFINNSVGTNTFSWSFGDGTFSNASDPLHVYGMPSTYQVTLIAGTQPCVDTFTLNINTSHPIDAVASIQDSLCVDTANVILDATFSTGLGISFYVDWGDGTNDNSTFPIITHTYGLPGNFLVTLVVSDTIGCVDTFQRYVYVEDTASVYFSIDRYVICLGEQIQLTDSISASTISWTWDFDDGTILGNLHNPKHAYDFPGVYTVSLTGNQLVCSPRTYQEIVTVNAYPLIDLGPDTSYCPGLTNDITLKNEKNPAEILNWSNGEIAPSITIKEPGYYWATSNVDGCLSTDSIWVKRHCYLNIPNSFSPNGDGLNDYFIPRQLLSSGVIGFSMKIFNRWGELIYATTAVDGRGWDGKYGGKDQPTGVFVYLIEAQWENNFRNTFQGNVSLLR